MPKANNLVASHARRKKIRNYAKGYYGARSRLIKTMRDAIRRAMSYSTAHRRRRPADFRKLWITRINAAARINGMSYSKLIHGLKLANIDMDRKVLADIAVKDPRAFSALAERAGAAL